MAQEPGAGRGAGGRGGGPAGGHEVPAIPQAGAAGTGADGAAAPTAWERGGTRSPYAAAARPGAPGTGAPGAGAPQPGFTQPGFASPGPVADPARPWAAPPGFGGAAGAATARPAAPDVPFALPQMAVAPLDGVAVASVVAGALGTGPVALALGVVGLRRTTRAWRRSPQIATTGIVLGSIGTLAWVVVGIVAAMGGFGGSGGSAVPGDVAQPRAVHSSLVATGNCVEFLPPQQEVGEVGLVPCSTPHVAQVVSTDELGTDATYPGPEAALEAAVAACESEISELGLDGPGRQAWAFVPTPTGWDGGERTTACLVRSSGALFEGSLVG